MRALAIGIFCLALAGCATTSTGVVPAQLLTCEAQPAAPRGDIRQRDVALYVVDLAEAGADCRTKLGSVRRLLTPEKK